jgi:hypothetical protein
MHDHTGLEIDEAALDSGTADIDTERQGVCDLGLLLPSASVL